MNSHSIKSKVTNTLPNKICRSLPLRLQEGNHTESEYQIFCCTDRDSKNKIIRILGIDFNITPNDIRFDDESFYISTKFTISSYKW